MYLSWRYVPCTYTRASCELPPQVELMYLVFTGKPGESYRRRLRSLFYLCYVFGALINSLVC